MFYFVKVENGKIINKNSMTQEVELPQDYKRITEDLYDSIGLTPCDFIEKDGVITNVEFIEPIIQPEPQPTEIELLQAQVNLQQALLEDLVFNIIPNMVGDEL